jgi:hypothetical protein
VSDPNATFRISKLLALKIQSINFFYVEILVFVALFSEKKIKTIFFSNQKGEEDLLDTPQSKIKITHY